jgi:hypothetical protein
MTNSKAKYDSVSEAAKSGDRLQTLLSLRDALSEAIDGNPAARDLASLSRNLQIVLREIAEMPEPEDDPAEDYAEKSREAREASKED